MLFIASSAGLLWLPARWRTVEACQLRLEEPGRIRVSPVQSNRGAKKEHRMKPYRDILRQKLVGCPVVPKNLPPDTQTRRKGTRKEAKDPAHDRQPAPSYGLNSNSRTLRGKLQPVS